jgi:hypothetical protein
LEKFMNDYVKLLEQTEFEFKDWQKSKRLGDRIPDAIWSAASKCAMHYGGRIVANKVGLNAGQLAVQTKIRHGKYYGVPTTIPTTEAITTEKNINNNITVTKIVAVETRSPNESHLPEWEITSPNGWILKGNNCDKMPIITAFINAISVNSGRNK